MMNMKSKFPLEFLGMQMAMSVPSATGMIFNCLGGCIKPQSGSRGKSRKSLLSKAEFRSSPSARVADSDEELVVGVHFDETDDERHLVVEEDEDDIANQLHTQTAEDSNPQSSDPQSESLSLKLVLPGLRIEVMKRGEKARLIVEKREKLHLVSFEKQQEADDLEKPEEIRAAAKKESENAANGYKNLEHEEKDAKEQLITSYQKLVRTLNQGLADNSAFDDDKRSQLSHPKEVKEASAFRRLSSKLRWGFAHDVLGNDRRLTG